MQMRQRFAQRQSNLQYSRRWQASICQVSPERVCSIAVYIRAGAAIGGSASLHRGSRLRLVRQLHHIIKITIGFIASDVKERQLAGMFAGDAFKALDARGVAWGASVAQQILAWRSVDGFSTPPPPYFGGTAPGVWRSPPAGTNADGTLPALFPQNAVLVPFAMTNHNQFRPGPPPALTSALYAADVNEVKAIGSATSTLRTPDQTHLALLWQAVGPVDENRAIRPLISPHASLVDNARFFALINIAAADATIAGFDSKYTYNLWRPYHAIRLADTDGNPDTTADPNWNSLFIAPRFQEYGPTTPLSRRPS